MGKESVLVFPMADTTLVSADEFDVVIEQHDCLGEASVIHVPKILVERFVSAIRAAAQQEDGDGTQA